MRMRWYEHLYVGEKAGKHRFSIIQNIRDEKLQPEVYVITPASNGNNILDIHPSATLLHPYYREQNLLILGLPWDTRRRWRWPEALWMRCFEKQGNLTWNSF